MNRATRSIGLGLLVTALAMTAGAADGLARLLPADAAPGPGGDAGLPGLGGGPSPNWAYATGSDPCADADYKALCPAPLEGRSQCVAVGLMTRGPLLGAHTFALAKAASDFGADAQQVLPLSLPPFLEAGVVRATCSAPSMLSATGSASAEHVKLALAGIVIEADLVSEATVSTTTSVGSSTGKVTHVQVQNVPVDVGTWQNFALPLGVGYLVVNEAHAAGGDCNRNEGSALRVFVDGVGEVIVGFAATTACRFHPTITTTADPGGYPDANPVIDRDHVRVTGPKGPATGVVWATICGPDRAVKVDASGCPAHGYPSLAPQLDATGQALSPAETLKGPGKYCWRATYLGDNAIPGGGDKYYLSEPHTNADTECVNVRVFPVVSTAAEGALSAPGAIRDRATVSGGFGTPTGWVTFWVCGPAEVAANGGDCHQGGTRVGTATLSGGQAVSADVTANENGRWCWRAAYQPFFSLSLGPNGQILIGPPIGPYLPLLHWNSGTECLTLVAPPK
jgi:hypothetical protein